MSKIVYISRQQSHQVNTLFSAAGPSQPIAQRQPASEKRIADPSSCMPKGQCYPIPSFFEYRAKPKEQDLR